MPHSEIPTGITYYPDGIWVAKSTPHRGDFNFVCDGTWEVKDGFIIEITSKMTQARYPDSEFGVEHLKVIRIDDNSLILCPSSATNLSIFKKL